MNHLHVFVLNINIDWYFINTVFLLTVVFVFRSGESLESLEAGAIYMSLEIKLFDCHYMICDILAIAGYCICDIFAIAGCGICDIYYSIEPSIFIGFIQYFSNYAIFNTNLNGPIIFYGCLVFAELWSYEYKLLYYIT